ncbi:MAG TPA: hypothetical protein VMG10_25090 [Gemmataceae bacterium]|nr:hypothetical protein [Gemmataceae bacterium]
MLPQHLVAQYWEEVERLLGQRHGLTPGEARGGIEDLRARLHRHQVGDVIYNRNASDVAETIAWAARHGGFPEPDYSELNSAEPVKMKESR